MKILHITPDIYIGGVATLLQEMTRFQRENGHKVSILCSTNTEDQIRRQTLFTSNGVDVRFSQYKNRYNPLKIIEIKRIIEDYDVIHVHLFPNQLIARIAFHFARKKTRKILITTEHSTYNNRRKYRIFKLFDRWLYNGYDAIIGISNQTEFNLRKWLGNKYSSTNKVLTIQNGINLQRFQCINQPRNSERIIIMVSRLEYPKDPFTLLRAIAKSESNPIVQFVGSGNLLKEIIEFAKSLNIENRVQLLGNRNDIPQLLSNANIGVLSTNWEGFGIVAVEYMAAGLPILASNVEGLREVVGDDESLFEVGDADELQKKIDNLLCDNSTYNKKSIFFRNRSQEFDITKMNQKYIEVYESLLSERID